MLEDLGFGMFGHFAILFVYGAARTMPWYEVGGLLLWAPFITEFLGRKVSPAAASTDMRLVLPWGGEWIETGRWASTSAT